MRPHSLLFSSDEEASRALSHAFKDLEFEVETCPEIFSAVEKITTRSFDVVVSDWDEGLEAVFLLKTVRELKGNHSAFTLAIANAEAAAAAREAGADLVLSRPLIPDEVKYALLTCDSFLAQMKSWLTRLGPSLANPNRIRPVPTSAGSSPDDFRNTNFKTWVRPRDLNKTSEDRTFNSFPRLRPFPPSPPRRTESFSPVVAAESIFGRPAVSVRVQTLFQAPSHFFLFVVRSFRKAETECCRAGHCRGISFRGLCIQRTAARKVQRIPSPNVRAGARRRRVGCTGPTGTGTGPCGPTAEENGGPQLCVRPDSVAYAIRRSEIHINTTLRPHRRSQPKRFRPIVKRPARNLWPQTQSGFRKA
jgi:CheY-like chemotaxis protein